MRNDGNGVVNRLLTIEEKVIIELIKKYILIKDKLSKILNKSSRSI